METSALWAFIYTDIYLRSPLFHISNLYNRLIKIKMHVKLAWCRLTFYSFIEFISHTPPQEGSGQFTTVEYNKLQQFIITIKTNKKLAAQHFKMVTDR